MGTRRSPGNPHLPRLEDSNDLHTVEQCCVESGTAGHVAKSCRLSCLHNTEYLASILSQLSQCPLFEGFLDGPAMVAREEGGLQTAIWSFRGRTHDGRRQELLPCSILGVWNSYDSVVITPSKGEGSRLMN